MRFKLTRAKVGIWLTHFGLILLLLGQLGTDMLSRGEHAPSARRRGQNYSESDRQAELAVIDTTDPDTDKVVAIGAALVDAQAGHSSRRSSVHYPGETLYRQFEC